MENKEIESFFIEMKDTSDLMVDLAYSALLYDKKEIAEEVYKLEERIDLLNNKIQHLAIYGIESDKDADKAIALIRLASSIEVIADSAREIADVVLREIEPHPIFKMSLRESDVIITRIVIGENSMLSEKTLGQIRLASETGMWVIAIRRGDEWIFGPEKGNIIYSGDCIFAKGPEDGETVLKKAATGLINKF